MRSIRRSGPYLYFFHFLFFMALTALTSACEQMSDTPPLRLGSSSWPGYEPLFIAESQGFYGKNTIHLIEAPANLGLAQAFRGTTIDAAALSLYGALQWHNTGQDLTILLVLDSSNGADMILARPDIKNIAELRGKRVAADMSAVSGYLLKRALEMNGMSLDDVQIVPLTSAEIPDALAQGTIDAGISFGRRADSMIAQNAHSLFDSSQISGEILDVLVVRTAYLKKYPKRVETLLKGWMRARDLIENWPSDTPLPEGLLKRIDGQNIFKGLSLTSIEQNQALLANDGAALLQLMTKIAAHQTRSPQTNTRKDLPKIEAQIFDTALATFTASSASKKGANHAP